MRTRRTLLSATGLALVAPAIGRAQTASPREQAVSSDLRALNVAINDAENTGNRDFLASILAPALAFYRASGAVDDAGRFLQKVATKNPPGELRPESVEIETLGNRAIVKCVIMQGGKSYHNIRLFVRTEA